MFGKQEVCFTCSQPIREKLYEYERYRNVYGLSRTDAADKTQLTNICCRTTAFGQTGVEERVKAAGVVSTVNNEMKVDKVTEYPTSRVTRVKGEELFPKPHITLAPKHREKINFQSFGGLQKDVSTIPERRAHGDKPSETRTTVRMSNRDVLGDLPSYPNGNWTLVDKSTFPKPEEMTEVFNRKIAVIHILCPVLSPDPLFITQIEAGVDVQTALTILEGVMITPKLSLSESLLKNNVIKAPQRLLHILKLQQVGKHPSISDFSEFRMVVSKVYRDVKKKVHVLELQHLRPVKLPRKTLQEDWLKSLVNPKITSVEVKESPQDKGKEEEWEESTDANEVVIFFGSTELSFEHFEVHSSQESSNEISKIPVGATLEGVKQHKQTLLLSLRKGSELYVLVITGKFNVVNVNRSLLTSDAKRTAFLELLDSL
jgi:DNA-directed RNA polymerase subunit N (RpoN/RPB10)